MLPTEYGGKAGSMNDLHGKIQKFAINFTNDCKKYLSKNIKNK